MPRHIFPASTVTNTTGAALRLTLHYTQTGGARASDLYTVDSANLPSAGIPNGVILTDTSGAYSAFAGPDDVDTLWLQIGAASSTRTQITATDAVGNSRRGDPLRRWKTKLAQSPSTATVAFVGDSTSDPATSAYGLLQRLQTLHTQQGEALYGMAPSDAYADGVSTNTSTTYTSATAAFTSSDVGRLIAGTNIPQATIISSVTNATTVVLSAAATGSGSSLSFYVGRHIVGGGSSGLKLSDWMANPSSASYPFNRNALVTLNPDLIVYSWGLNDIRLGGLGITVAAIVPNLITLLKSLIDWTQINLPNADILLRMPNPMLTSDVSSLHYVTDGTNTNPAGQAQIYSDALREAYLYFKGYAPGVDVIDIQAKVFGTQCVATHPLMTDQLHPSPRSSANGLVPYSGGYVAIADAIAEHIGYTRQAFTPTIHSYRYRQEFMVSAGGSTFLDLTAKINLGAPAAQAPVTTSDTLYVSGFDGPISLSGKTITRPFGTTNIRISGLTGLDFTNYVGKIALIGGAHADSTTGDRQIVAVDLPSTATVSFGTATATVTGARTGALHDATAVLCTPPATFEAAGLYMVSCTPSANDTVRIVFYNPTGGTVDLASGNFAFWVVR